MGNGRQRQYIFLLVVLVLTLVLTFFVLKSFVLILALGAVFAVTFQPVFHYFARNLGERRALAALLTTLVVIACIIVPLGLVGTQVVYEAIDLYSRIKSGVPLGLDNILVNLSQYLPEGAFSGVDTHAYLEQGLRWLVGHTGAFFGNVASFVASAILFLIILYYLLKDGGQIHKAILKYSPLADNDDEAILDKLALAINSVMRGRVLLALLQGLLAAIGMFIFGVPNPALWGSVTALAALVPGIGTALVLIPTTLYLLLQSSMGNTLGFLIWAVILVGLIDNLLGPKLLGRGTHVHPLLILLSVLGGITLFGPLGFVIGPLIISLLFALLEILFAMSKNKI